MLFSIDLVVDDLVPVNQEQTQHKFYEQQDFFNTCLNPIPIKNMV